MKVYVISIILYIVMILTVSFFSRKKLVDEEGYLLGGDQFRPGCRHFLMEQHIFHRLFL